MQLLALVRGQRLRLRHPLIIGFRHEMNAYWYSWACGHLPASTFVTAWRHNVTLFRAQHADNVTWLWMLQADEAGTGSIASWRPGANFVTWVGIGGYCHPPAVWDQRFATT